MTSRCKSLLAVALIAAMGVSGCATVAQYNPFKKNAPQEVAEGERISIVAADQTLEPAEALKGVDFSIPPVAAIADWPLPGGTPEQSIENVDAAPALTVAWKRDIGQKTKSGNFVTAPLVAAAGRIYTMDGEATVAAHDATTGAQIWRVNLRPTDNRRDKEGFGGGLAFAGGKLYVTSGYRLVAQLDAATGAVVWTTRTEEPIHGAPTVAGGRVLAVAVDNTLMTFDAATGAPGWTYQALAESARILSASSPAVQGDTVVASFGSGELVALRSNNGNDLWNVALSRASRTSALSEIRDIAGRPVIYQGDVFAVSHSGVFAATDLRTGQTRWSLPVVGVSSPLPAGDVIYVVAKDGQLICASRESGQIYWIRDLNEGFAENPDNKRHWYRLWILGKKKLKPIWSGPLLARDRLISVNSRGELASVNAKTGVIDRKVDLGAPVLLSPIAVGGMIYVVTDNAQLIALR